MGDKVEDRRDYGERLGKVETDVHWLVTSFPDIFKKIDGIIEAIKPKGMGIGTIASVLGSFAVLFTAVIFISKSTMAPVEAQNQQLAIAIQTQGNQITTAIQAMQANMMQNTNLIQLTNKEISTIGAKVEDNENTLRWIIFEKELPVKITEMNGHIKVQKVELDGIIRTLKAQLNGRMDLLEEKLRTNSALAEKISKKGA